MKIWSAIPSRSLSVKLFLGYAVLVSWLTDLLYWVYDPSIQELIESWNDFLVWEFLFCTLAITAIVIAVLHIRRIPFFTSGAILLLLFRIGIILHNYDYFRKGFDDRYEIDIGWCLLELLIWLAIFLVPFLLLYGGVWIRNCFNLAQFRRPDD